MLNLKSQASKNCYLLRPELWSFFLFLWNVSSGMMNESLWAAGCDLYNWLKVGDYIVSVAVKQGTPLTWVLYILYYDSDRM